MDRPLLGKDAIAAGVAAGNINIGGGSGELLELSAAGRVAEDAHAEALEAVLVERRSSEAVIPTAVADVKVMLRALGAEVTLFGEHDADRADRLRRTVGRLQVARERGASLEDKVVRVLADAMGETRAAVLELGGEEEEEEHETFYTPAGGELVEARKRIGEYSILQSQERLERYRELVRSEEKRREVDLRAKERYEWCSRLEVSRSQAADRRAVSGCVFSPVHGVCVATCGWSGGVKVWLAEDASLWRRYRGHGDRATGVVWHPHAGGAVREALREGRGVEDGEDVVTESSKEFAPPLASSEAIAQAAEETNKTVLNTPSYSPSLACLATASATGDAHLWSLDSTEPVARLQGHNSRLGKIAWHPMGDHIATSSFDRTWRLWDVATQTQLLHQEGHARAVYPIAFHPDGSLVGTGDLGGVGRLWDLRTGRSVMELVGHMRQLLALAFHPNGWQIATGSDDNTIRIWDMRKRKATHLIPAHSQLVSQLAFQPVSGEVLASASYDATVKLWRTRDWKPINTLHGHGARVMGVHWHPDETKLLSSSWDRTFKLWTPI